MHRSGPVRIALALTAGAVLASAAQAGPKLRPLSEDEMRRRFADTCIVVRPEGTECFSADGDHSFQGRAMIYDRYWVRGSRLCVGYTPRTADCRDVRRDALGALYFAARGQSSKFVLKPTKPRR